MIVRNATFRLGAVLINFATVFVSTPLLVHQLGQETYGVWLLLLSIGNLLSLLDLGVSSALTLYVAQEVETSDWSGLESTLRSAIAFYLLVAALIFAIHGGLALYPGGIFDLPAQEVGAAIWTLLIVGLAVALGFPARVYEGVLLALERHWLVAVTETVAAVLRLGLIVVWTWAGGGLVWLAAIHGSLLCLTYILYLACGLRLLPQTKLQGPGWFPRRIRDLLTYGRDTMLKTIGDRAANQGPSLILGSFSTVAVAQYGIGLRLMTYCNLLVGQAVQVAKPRFVTSDARSDKESIRQLLLRSSLYSAVMAGYLGLGLALLVRDFIILWVGDAFAPTVEMFLILLFPMSLYLSMQPVETLLLGLSLHRFTGWIRLAQAGIILGGIMLLGKEQGVLAAGYGIGAALILHPVLLPTYACRKIGLSLAVYWRSAFLRPALAVIISWGLMRLFLMYWQIGTWLDFLVAGCVLTLIFGLLVVTLALPAAERKFWLDRLTPWRGR